MEKNKNVSIAEPIKDEVNGAIYHFFFLNSSNICTSNNWATINATPEPAAILIETKSTKFVENCSMAGAWPFLDTFFDHGEAPGAS